MGFRPFIYRLAIRHQQNGWVANSSHGAAIAIEGSTTQQQQFLFDLHSQLPPFACIDSLVTRHKPLQKFNTFQIKESISNKMNSAFVLPDISPCQDCIAELFTPQSRFYHYPFISCCHCGPRYSIMTQQPYDRLRTSMVDFIPCAACSREYSSVDNRRFYSQTIACPSCGPQLYLHDRKRNILDKQEHALSTAIDFLNQGKIIAIKGIGGFQLLANATNPHAVAELRRRKHRPAKPFALMVENLKSAKSLCQVNKTEQLALTSSASPIVLLKSLNTRQITDGIAPYHNTLGIMLPASPLHHLLCHDMGKPLITTSGNQTNEPICTTDQQAFDRLGNIADFFLTHQRSIIHPLDDSIIRCINNKPVVIRRARGYSPLPICISKTFEDTLAVGGQMKNTVAINQGNQLILSQHIGDLTTITAQQQFQKTITDILNFYSITPTTIKHDLHPDYHSSRIADQFGLNLTAIQHHHAHIFSCMAEHDLQAPVLGFAWDGTGLGTDHTLWGGECLLLSEDNVQRYAYLRPFPLVGGEKAAYEPRRSALGLLYEINPRQIFTEQHLDFLTAFTRQELNLLQLSLKKQLNTPYTSSIGRLFDAVSSILGLCHINQFEGQAAMQLEQLASTCVTEEIYPFRLELKTPVIINWAPMLIALIKDLHRLNHPLIAAKFHNTLAEITVQIAKHAQIKNIVLSGGCFQNAYLAESCIKKLETAGFTVYTHERIPPNDGGLALGQLYANVITGH